MSTQKASSGQRLYQSHQSSTNLQQSGADGPAKEQKVQEVPFFKLFRFATKEDPILITIGTFASLAMGSAMPLFSLLWGKMTDSFAQGGDAMVDKARDLMFIFFGIGGGVLVAGWIMFASWMIAGQRQAIACRKAYLQSLLRQQIGWFDVINQSQLSSQFSTDCFAYQGALGQKNSSILMTLGMFIVGFCIAFSIGWLMTFVMLASIPVIGLTGYIFMWSVQQKDQKTSKDYAEAGGLAEQALTAIKTVKMLNGQQWQTFQYAKCLKIVTSKALKFAAIAGVGTGSMLAADLLSYALGFWYGSHCVEVTNVCNSGQIYTAGDVLIVFFSILMAGFNFSQLTPALQKIAQGRQAGARIFKTIDRQPLIKNSINPIRPKQFKGIIKFENVTFRYPKQKNRKILDNISLQFNTHSSALVGESGCGKSTIFQLLMRFYDPEQGKILLDGVDLRDLDLIWLRQNIGYVGQEPVLFATSIKQNLSFGKEDATDEEINQALRKAEAFDFVQTLERKLQTYVGTGGSQLSGGQKQRIAIARALLRNPKILLLDEATSALDRKNQRLIQSTLDKISQQRTTITIAHRTKTIMHCNMIYVLEKGKIQESGKFCDLKRFKDIDLDHQQQQISKDLLKKNSKKDNQKKTFAKYLQQNKNGFIDFNNLIIQEDQTKLTKEQADKAQKQRLLSKYQQGTYKRIFQYGKGAMWAFALAIVMAVLNGVIYPIFSIFLAKMLTTLLTFLNDKEQARKDANMYALIYVFLAIAGFFVNFFQTILFSYVGEKITKKIRIQSYGKMLKMPIPWFDIPKNNPGGLTARLSSDCKMVNGLTTTFIGISIQNLATLSSSIIIGLIFEWRTALVAIGLIPIMILAGVLQMKQSLGFSSQSDTVYKDSSSLITEAMLNIRTVTSFGYQSVILNKYSKLLETPLSLGVKKGNISGVLYGITNLTMFIIFALIFFLGTVFIRDNPSVTVQDVFTAIYAIVFGAMTVGNNSHFLPDIAAAKQAAASLFQIIDAQDEDQIQARQKSKLLTQGIKGDIQLKEISFKYATRNTELFKKFNLKLDKGKKVAFVGPSGCGKSTIFQMILRFYDPSEGQILIDGQNIKDYDIHYLRNAFSVVSQQPVLFNGSFRYNIIYNLKNVKNQQMIKAVHQANAYAFIKGSQTLRQNIQHKKQDQLKQLTQQVKQQSKFRDLFDRSVGIKGSHISGGQKQRIAIARTILRNPVILLLDEATSALDNENEKKVQDSLDRIMKGRSTISIAHRINTIKNSDQIDVFDHGRVVEKGTYHQLVSKKGYFYNLERGTDFL